MEVNRSLMIKEEHNMSKVVAHMAKMKVENLSGIQKHNERLNHTYSNKMVDTSRSHLNYDLVKGSELSYKETVDKHIADNIVLKRALRKDAVLVNEWVISSDKEFFDKLSEQQVKEYFQTAVDYFNEKCDNHVIYATVHLDESTPHMHLGVVPIIDGKLSSKKLFDRKMLREIQDELPERLKSKGFDIERGILGSEQKHLTVKEYKANKQAISEMSEQIENLNVIKTHLEGRTDVLKGEVYKYTKEIEKLNTEQNRVQKSISEQKKESETLEKKISVEKNTLNSVSNHVDNINQRVAVAWHDDWLATKAEFPDFSMKTGISQKFEKEIDVDENTPQEQGFDFRRTLNLFSEKVKGFTDFLKDKALELERKAKELFEREQSLEKRERAVEKQKAEIDRKLERVNDSVVLLAENEVKLERIDKMIASRNEVLVNVNKDWSINQSKLINQLGWIANGAREQRLGNGWVVDIKAIDIINQTKSHLEKTNPATLIKANQEINQSYQALKHEFKTQTPIDPRIDVAKENKEMQGKIKELRLEVFTTDKEKFAYKRMITNLVRETEHHKYAYELQYALGKTFYAESDHLSDKSREEMIDKLSDVSKGFFDGYQQAEKDFENKEIQRLNHFYGRDRDDMSL